jgi:hypothetical protein
VSPLRLPYQRGQVGQGRYYPRCVRRQVLCPPPRAVSRRREEHSRAPPRGGFGQKRVHHPLPGRALSVLSPLPMYRSAAVSHLALTCSRSGSAPKPPTVGWPGRSDLGTPVALRSIAPGSCPRSIILAVQPSNRSTAASGGRPPCSRCHVSRCTPYVRRCRCRRPEGRQRSLGYASVPFPHLLTLQLPLGLG